MNLSRQQWVGTRWRWLFLGLILLAALGLRTWGIGFGLPYIYHYDEHFYINTALKLGAGVINNPPYAPTGLSNILVVEYGAYFVLGKMLGLFASAQEFEAAFRNDPTIFYLLARLTSALSGVAAVLALYVLGKSVSNWIIGLIAATFLAISFLHVRDSHYAVPDVAMSSLVVLAVALSALSLRSGKQRYIYLAALAGGLAIAMKWTGLPVVVAVGWASLWVDSDPQKSLSSRLLNRLVIFMPLLFVLGFTFGSLQILINPVPYINEAIGQSRAGEAGGFDIWQVDTLPGWFFYGKTLLYGVGLILLVLSIVGVLRRLILAIKTTDKMSILILLFPLIYYLLMGSTRHYFARYAIPLIPFVALFAAEAIMTIAIWLKNRHVRLGLSIGAALTVIATFQPLAQSIWHNIILSHEDTRTLAKQWIEANIPMGAKVAIDWPTHGPPLSTLEKIVPYSDKLYDVYAVGGTGLSDHPVAWYRGQGFDYLIASSFIYQIPLVYKKQDAERQAFYASLDQDLKLVQEFRPYTGADEPPFIFDEIYGPAVSLWERERPGPTIKVYKIQ